MSDIERAKWPQLGVDEPSLTKADASKANVIECNVLGRRGAQRCPGEIGALEQSALQGGAVQIASAK